jgi:hypothetical protein
MRGIDGESKFDGQGRSWASDTRVPSDERREQRMANSILRGRASTAGPPVAVVVALLVACGLGAVAEYFFLDRRHGAARRHELRDRALAGVRRRVRHAIRQARYRGGIVSGGARRAGHAVSGVGRRKEEPDDMTLAQKVESIAFRRAGIPKSHVKVNAEKSVIYLRGQLDDDEQIDELIRASQAIDGVAGVRSLLHTPARTNDPTP